MSRSPLAGFPVRTWRADRALWRIHRADRDVWWFSSDGTGRFDPVDVDGMGACYLAQEPLGAFVEVFRTRLELDEDDVTARRLAEVRFDRDLRLADVCSRRALRFGVTAEIGAGGDYERSQAFALRGGRSGIRRCPVVGTPRPVSAAGRCRAARLGGRPRG